MGITQTGYGFGGIIGASLLPFLGENLGWRTAVQLAAVFILFTGPFVYQLYQEQKDIKDVIDLPEEQNNKPQSFRERLLAIFRHKPLFRVCFLGILFGISEGAMLAHLVVFLTEDLGMSRVIAGLGLAILHLGGILGLLAWGAFSDRFFKVDRRLCLFLVGFSTGFMYLLFGLFLNHSSISQIIIFGSIFLFGFLALGWSGAYFTTVGEVASRKQAGIATGLSLVFIRIGMLIAPPLFGLIADINGFYKFSWLIFGFVIIGISTLFLRKN